MISPQKISQTNNLKILVTGATGFLGRHIVRWLINNGYDVIATSTSENKAKAFDWYDKVTFIPCDYFTEKHNFYEYFGKPEIIIHTAWKNLHDYMGYVQIENLISSMHLLSDFIHINRTKIVVVGTDKEYGRQNGCLSENSSINPNTSYGFAKDLLRRYLEFHSNQNGGDWNWIRLFFVYGDGQDSRSLLPQLEKAISNGEKEFPMSPGNQLRDYLPITTAAEYICKISLSQINGVVNCCSGKPISIKSLVESQIKILHSDIVPKYGVYPYSACEGMDFWGDDKKLREIIDNYQ